MPEKKKPKNKESPENIMVFALITTRWIYR